MVYCPLVTKPWRLEVTIWRSGSTRVDQSSRGALWAQHPWLFHQQEWLLDMGMDQYLLIQFLGEWTSIYQLFWCELQGYKVLTHCHIDTYLETTWSISRKWTFDWVLEPSGSFEEKEETHFGQVWQRSFFKRFLSYCDPCELRQGPYIAPVLFGLPRCSQMGNLATKKSVFFFGCDLWPATCLDAQNHNFRFFFFCAVMTMMKEKFEGIISQDIFGGFISVSLRPSRARSATGAPKKIIGRTRSKIMGDFRVISMGF